MGMKQKKPYYQRRVFKMKQGGPKFDRRNAPKHLGLGASTSKQTGSVFNLVKNMFAGRGQDK